MMDIIILIFFATLANADNRVEIEMFGKEQDAFLRRFLGLPNGIPSHDTIQRVSAIIPSEFMENFQKQWDEILNRDKGSKIMNHPAASNGVSYPSFFFQNAASSGVLNP